MAPKPKTFIISPENLCQPIRQLIRVSEREGHGTGKLFEEIMAHTNSVHIQKAERNPYRIKLKALKLLKTKGKEKNLKEDNGTFLTMEKNLSDCRLLMR